MSVASPPAASGWRRLNAACSSALSWLLSLSVLILVFPVSLQIFSRFTDLLPHYIWTEEMARLMFVWMIMIGAMLGVREGTHFTVDVWPRLGPRATAALNLLSGVAVLVFAVVFLWFGVEFTRFGWNRTSELADLPLWLIHVAWPITGLAWIVFLGEQMLDNWRVLVGSRS